MPGQSKYSMYSLIRLNFDLITGFSVVPLQLFSMIGMAVSPVSALLVVILLVRRIIVGPRPKACSPCSAWCSFFIGVALFGIGLLGEYVGRIYAQVRERPRYIVEAVLEAERGGRRRCPPRRGRYAVLEAGAREPWQRRVRPWAGIA
jgi:undecaprenyl-phosphate 4-deoxy-4-formamido-L-arabinose transferase